MLNNNETLSIGRHQSEKSTNDENEEKNMLLESRILGAHKLGVEGMLD